MLGFDGDEMGKRLLGHEIQLPRVNGLNIDSIILHIVVDKAFWLCHANAIPITAVTKRPQQMSHLPGFIGIDRQTYQAELAVLIWFIVSTGS